MYVNHGGGGRGGIPATPSRLSGLGSLGLTDYDISTSNFAATNFISDFMKAVVAIFGPIPGQDPGRGQDMTSLQFISPNDWLIRCRLNFISAASLQFWTRSRGGYASKSDQKGPGFLAFDTPRDPRFAFDVAHIQKLAGLPPTGIVDQDTLNTLIALTEDAFRSSWPGKWAYTNMVNELGRDSENDFLAMAARGSIGVYDRVGLRKTSKWTADYDKDKGRLAASVAHRAAGTKSKPDYTPQITDALTAQRNLRLALRDVWWVTPAWKTPEDTGLVDRIREYQRRTNRLANAQRAKLVGAAEPELMGTIKAHLKMGSSIGREGRLFKDVFQFPDTVYGMPTNPKIIEVFYMGYRASTKSSIDHTKHAGTAVNELPTMEKSLAESKARSDADRARVAEAQRREEEQRRQQEERRRQEEQRRQQQRQQQAQSNRAVAEKMRIKLKVLNDGIIHLNDKKKFNAPLRFYLGEIEKLLLDIPQDLRAEFTADIKAALTAHLYNIMPQLKAGSPEFIKAQEAKAEKERIAAETLARLKAEADAMAAKAAADKAAAEAAKAAADAEAQRLAAEQAVAAEAQRVADEQAAAARTVEEKRIADEAAARAAADKAAADAAAAAADAAAAEAQRVASEAAAKSAADAASAAKLEEERQKAANGESTPEEVVSKTVAIVNEMTDGEGGLEIAKEVIKNAVDEDPSKAESADQLIKVAEGAPKQASAGGGGGIALVAALGIGAFLLFGRRR